MGSKEVCEMSQRPVYVRRPIYDPDPDPDPIGVIAIGILAVIGVIGGALFTNPNVLTNLQLMLDPELKEIEEKRIEAQKEMMTIIGIVMVLVAIIVLAYIFWRWNTRKKEAKARIRLNSKRLRTMRRMVTG